MDIQNASFYLPPYFLNDNDFYPDPNKKSGFGPGPNNDVDDLMLSYLTTHLAHTSIQDNKTRIISEKPLVYSTSPKSTISGFEFGFGLGLNRSWYEAAGRVAHLRGLPRHTTNNILHNHHLNKQWALKRSNCNCQRHRSTWQQMSTCQHPTSCGVGPMKRQSVGTGVFLPRTLPRQQYHQCQQSEPREIMLARRNVILEEQRKEYNTSPLVGLPADWTY